MKKIKFKKGDIVLIDCRCQDICPGTLYSGQCLCLFKKKKFKYNVVSRFKVIKIIQYGDFINETLPCKSSATLKEKPRWCGDNWDCKYTLIGNIKSRKNRCDAQS